MPKPEQPRLHSLISRQWTLAVAATFLLLLLTDWLAEFALKSIAENILSETLETPVQIDAVSLGLIEGNLTFHNTRISNIQGFSKPNIFTARTTRATGAIAELILLGKVDLDRIEIDHIETWIQKDDQGYNYEILLRNLQEPGPDDAKDHAPAPAKSNRHPDSAIQIDEIRLNDVKAAVYNLIPSTTNTPEAVEADRLDLRWKSIVLRDVDLGAGGREAVRHLSKVITDAILTAAARKVGSLSISLIEKGLSVSGSTLKIIGEEATSEAVQERIEEVGRGASEWLHRMIPHHEKKTSPSSNP